MRTCRRYPLTSLACHVSFHHSVLRIILLFLLFSFYSSEIFAYDPLIISRLHTGPLLIRRFPQLSVCEGGNAYAYGDEFLRLGKTFSWNRFCGVARFLWHIFPLGNVFLSVASARFAALKRTITSTKPLAPR